MKVVRIIPERSKLAQAADDSQKPAIDVLSMFKEPLDENPDYLAFLRRKVIRDFNKKLIVENRKELKKA